MKLVEMSVIWEMDEVLGHLVPSELQPPSGVIELEDGTRLAWDIELGHVGGEWRIEQDPSHPLVPALGDMVSGVLGLMCGAVM